MAAKKTTEPVPEINPARGGSYVRNPDGTLAQTEGPDMVPPAAEIGVTKPAPANTPTSNT